MGHSTQWRRRRDIGCSSRKQDRHQARKGRPTQIPVHPFPKGEKASLRFGASPWFSLSDYVHPSCRRRHAMLEFQAELRNGRNQVRLYKDQQQTYVVKIRVWMSDCSRVDRISGSPMKMQIQHEKFYRKPYDNRVGESPRMGNVFVLRFRISNLAARSRMAACRRPASVESREPT